MDRLKLVALPVVLTSVFWLALGAWLFTRQPAGDDAGGTGDGEIAMTADSPPKTSGVPLVPDQGAAPGSVDSLLLIPVAGVRADDLIDSFAKTQGIDIPAPPGMPVIAAAPGIVEKVAASGKGGTALYLRSPDRTRLYHYAHIDAVATGLSEGKVIGAGDQLGSVGSAGKVEGKPAHLHFAVSAIMPDHDWSEDKRPINPYPLLGGRSQQSR